MSQSQKLQIEAPEGTRERKSGRAVFDEGRTVWEWQTATGVFERHVSEEQMARLEASGLQLVEQAPQNAGCAIYGSEPPPARQAHMVRKHVYLARPAPVRVAPVAEPISALRQLWRRLVPAT